MGVRQNTVQPTYCSDLTEARDGPSWNTSPSVSTGRQEIAFWYSARAIGDGGGVWAASRSFCTESAGSIFNSAGVDCNVCGPSRRASHRQCTARTTHQRDRDTVVTMLGRSCIASSIVAPVTANVMAVCMQARCERVAAFP